MTNLSSLKEYVKSSLVTFIATFAAAVAPGFGDASFTKSALVALLLVGIRAGVKAVLEVLAVIKPTTSITPAV